MAGSRADYDAAQHRQKRRVRAELWLRKQNKDTRYIYIYIFYYSHFCLCSCMCITCFKNPVSMSHSVLFPPHTRWSFGILLYELITLGKVLSSYLPKFYSTFPSYLNPNLLITTIKPSTTLQSQ